LEVRPLVDISMRLATAMLLGGLSGDRRIQLLELLILSDEFADDGHGSASDREVAVPASNLQGRDEGVGGGGVEVERQYLIHGWMWMV